MANRPPTHSAKVATVLEYARRFDCHTLIETGTFKGHMVRGTKPWFSKIYSIELDPRLASIQRETYKDNPNITILWGDSTDFVPVVLQWVTERCVFWLDAHYSGGVTAKGKTNTPILEELKAILDSKLDCVILIDDARCFTGENDYPSIDDVRDFVLLGRPDWEFEVENDIIRAHRRENQC